MTVVFLITFFIVRFILAASITYAEIKGTASTVNVLSNVARRKSPIFLEATLIHTINVVLPSSVHLKTLTLSLTLHRTIIKETDNITHVTYEHKSISIK